MFTNREHCTVYEKTIVSRTPAWVRHEEGAVYWENTDGQEVSTSGTGTSRTAADSAFIVMPVSSVGYVPKPDDRIVSGLCTDGQPPKTALTVMSVKDFRYGSKENQHLEVRAK